MAIAEDLRQARPARATPATLDVVVPVFNEEVDLEPSVRRLRSYLDNHFPLAAVITVADNASTDRTWEIATRLAHEVPGVRAVHLDRKGRGRALKEAWASSQAPVLAYMDVDLATGLDALLPLVAPLVSGHSDLAIGSRLAPGARVVRGPKREVISRAYNLLVRAVLRSRFSDAQCGFKAIRGDAARQLLPLVQDDEWFFDTELLTVAERNGLRIHEVAVDWVDDPDSRVDVARTAVADLRGLWRLARTRQAVAPPELAQPAGEVASFARVGAWSTLAWLGLWLALRPAVGAFWANGVALLVCTAANTAANARWTFAARAPFSPGDQLGGAAAALAASLAATTAALAAAEAVGATSAAAELTGLLAAHSLVALARFVLLRAWAFRTHGRVATTRAAR